MKTSVILPLALLMLLSGGGVLWLSMKPDAPSLATIAPAAGGSAKAEGSEPKKSHTGKILSAEPTLPKVRIGGQDVLTRTMLYEQELDNATPESLKGDKMGYFLGRRITISGYAHNPSIGPADAPLVLIEMNDLSCVQCMETSKVVDGLMQTYQGRTRLMNIHTPVSHFNDVNLPAFYGKVAQRGGVFWEYRKALQTLTNPSPDAYFELLIQAGMNRTEARRLLQTESRRFYRELDADTKLAQSLHLGNPPHVFVNGIHVGINAIPLDKLTDVASYDMNRPRLNTQNMP